MLLPTLNSIHPSPHPRPQHTHTPSSSRQNAYYARSKKTLTLTLHLPTHPHTCAPTHPSTHTCAHIHTHQHTDMKQQLACTNRSESLAEDMWRYAFEYFFSFFYFSPFLLHWISMSCSVSVSCVDCDIYALCCCWSARCFGPMDLGMALWKCWKNSIFVIIIGNSNGAKLKQDRQSIHRGKKSTKWRCMQMYKLNTWA